MTPVVRLILLSGPPPIPSGFAFLVDASGAYLRDAEGAYLIAAV